MAIPTLFVCHGSLIFCCGPWVKYWIGRVFVAEVTGKFWELFRNHSSPSRWVCLYSREEGPLVRVRVPMVSQPLWDTYNHVTWGQEGGKQEVL